MRPAETGMPHNRRFVVALREWAAAIRECATVLALLGVPVVVAYWQHSSADEAVRQQYVAMAVGLLQKPTPERKDDSDTELRAWAVAVINRNAPVPLPESLKENLIIGKLHWLFGDGVSQWFPYGAQPTKPKAEPIPTPSP